MNRSAASLVMVTLLALAVPGCCTPAKGPNTAGAMAVNTTCPLTDEQAEQDVTVDYQGKKIAFCCKGCVAKFNKMSDAEKDKVLAKAMTYPAR